MQYANSLEPNEMPRNSVSHPAPSYLTLGLHLYHISCKSEDFETTETDDNLADDNFRSKRRVKQTFYQLNYVSGIQTG